MSKLPDVRDLVAHRPPMLLIDELLDHGDDWARCRVTVRSEPLCEPGPVPAVWAIEYMAQTVAALVGIRQLQGGERPRVGYLVGVRELELSLPDFPEGTVLDVHAQLIWVQHAAGQFRCQVSLDGRPVAHATMTVYQPPTEGGTGS